MNYPSFKDHFSKQASEYAQYRPRYPKELFKYLAGLCHEHELAWDCATGNGQAALSLVDHFAKVVATDASEKQITAATPHEKIVYRVEPAENTSLAKQSVDLITVAQAIHWFNHEKFYTEVQRVLKPQGILAVWAYGLHHISPEIDGVTRRYYHDVVGPFWPPERTYVEEKLETIPFPFNKIKIPEFFMTALWDVEAALNYFRTWSATQKYKEAQQQDPLQKIEAEFRQAWGSAEEQREVKWPLYFCIGRKN